MIKKSILCVLVLLFLYSAIAPNKGFSGDLGGPGGVHPDKQGDYVAEFIILGVVFIAGAAILYYYSDNSSEEQKEDKSKNELTMKRVANYISPEGNLIFYKW